MDKGVKVESVEEWIKRGNKVKRVDFKNAHERNTITHRFTDNPNTSNTLADHKKNLEKVKEARKGFANGKS